MKPQFSNFLYSSSLLWLDHTILKYGEAFSNVGSKFYPTNQYYNGCYNYAAPFKQFVYDCSISGANVITGVYIDNNFVGTGVSGFIGINYQEGLAIFSAPLPPTAVVSGNYSTKELNTSSISEQDEYVLLEGKFFNKNVITRNTGNYTNQIPYPVIYARNEAGNNKAFSFGGEYCDKNTLNLTVIADSQYQLDAVVSILKDRKDTYFPIFTASEFPFNQLNSLRTGCFDYNSYFCSKIADGNSAYITEVGVSQIRSSFLTDLKGLNTSIYVAIIEIELEFLRYPRLP